MDHMQTGVAQKDAFKSALGAVLSRRVSANAVRTRAIPRGTNVLPIERKAPSDEELVRRIAQHDARAFEILYYRYAAKLSGYLRRMLRREDLAEEALNDVMMLVWKKADSFDALGPLSSWLFGIARNKGLKVLSVARRDAARYTYVGHDEERLDTVQEGSNSDEPDTQLANQQLMQSLSEGLAGLPPKQRLVVELACIEGLSYREIADIMDCPVNTIKTRMFHARKSLKGLF